MPELGPGPNECSQIPRPRAQMNGPKENLNEWADLANKAHLNGIEWDQMGAVQGSNEWSKWAWSNKAQMKGPKGAQMTQPKSSRAEAEQLQLRRVDLWFNLDNLMCLFYSGGLIRLYWTGQ